MFGQIQLVLVPSTLRLKLNVGYKIIIGSLGSLFVGMVMASLWQWLFDIKSSTLMDSPLLLRLMMIGGFAVFVVTLIMTRFVLPIWHYILNGWR